MTTAQEHGLIGDDSDETLGLQSLLNTGGEIVFEKNKTYQTTATLEMVEGTNLDLNGSTLNFRISGTGECLIVHSRCTVKNGRVINSDGNIASSVGNHGCPIVVGQFEGGFSPRGVTLDNLTIESKKKQGTGILVTAQANSIEIKNIHFPSSAYLSSAIEVHWGVDNNITDSNNLLCPYNITINNITAGTFSLANSPGAFIFISAAYNINVNNCVFDTGSRGIHLSCGDFGDDYMRDSFQTQYNKIGTGIDITNVKALNMSISGLSVSGYTKYGLKKDGVTCSCTSGSPILTNVTDTNKLFIGRWIEVKTINNEDETNGSEVLHAKGRVINVAGSNVTIDRNAFDTGTDFSVRCGSWDMKASIKNCTFQSPEAPFIGTFSRYMNIENVDFIGGNSGCFNLSEEFLHNKISNCRITKSLSLGIQENRKGFANDNVFIDCDIFDNNIEQSKKTDRTNSAGVYFSSYRNKLIRCTIGMEVGERQFFGISIDPLAKNTVIKDVSILGVESGGFAIKNGHGSPTQYDIKTLNNCLYIAPGITYQAPNSTPLINEISNDGRIVFSDSDKPTSGNWTEGDIVYNNSPTNGGNIGFVCTTSGSPGTWKAFGIIGYFQLKDI